VKLLVIKASALGDVVHALPVLPYLKSVDPEMDIDWLVEEPIAPLLEGHPGLRKVLQIRTREWRKNLVGGCLRMLAAGISLRRERYDLVLDLQGNSKSGFFTRMTGAPKRYGFDADSVREWANCLSTNCKVAVPEEGGHVTDRLLVVARQALPGGSAPPSAGSLPIDPEARRRVLDRLAAFGLGDGKLVILHCGTTWKSKRWPLENWLEVTRDFARNEGIRPVLTWGSRDELTAAEQLSKNTTAIVWPGCSLPELAALLARADMVIGPDTGPIHIAAAVGSPTVSLYRATDAARNGPRGGGHIRLQAPLDCSPCRKKECGRDSECAHSISVAAVLTAARKLLAK